MVEQGGFVPFNERDDIWHDLEPIEQYEGGQAPIAPIPYPAQYTEVMGYFRAILAKQEVSERAFWLTTEVIDHSQGNYGAWAYRRKMLDELKMDLGKEFEWLRSKGKELEKNY